MHVFEVTGIGPFPTSMLRFDCAWPYTDEDADKIARSFDGHNARSRWTVQLQTGSRHAPTEGRWESFGCQVASYA